MPYCIPEQPPPLTKTRRASCGLSSLASSSASLVWASVVRETTACSITPEMLPRLLRVPSPRHARGSGRGRGELPPPELEPHLHLGLAGAGGPRDHLRHHHDPARDRAV